MGYPGPSMVELHLGWAAGPGFAPEPRPDDPPPAWIAGYAERDGTPRRTPLPHDRDPWVFVDALGEVLVSPLGRPRREYNAAVRRDPCAYCGAWCWATTGHNFATSSTLDHIDPKADGGTGEVNNTVAACRACNSAKGDTPMLVFLLGRARPQQYGSAVV